MRKFLKFRRDKSRKVADSQSVLCIVLNLNLKQGLILICLYIKKPDS
ncbi:hypothetical protein BSF42_39350 [Flavobacterium sp. ACN6]|nr:hypothetical protein BSF42_39350 [Flavobacterium sp. ACN6]